MCLTVDEGEAHRLVAVEHLRGVVDDGERLALLQLGAVDEEDRRIVLGCRDVGVVGAGHVRHVGIT